MRWLRCGSGPAGTRRAGTPLLCFLDNTGEALTGILRPARAGSNTAADHVQVLDAALAQIPDEHRYGTPVLVRADTAGCTHAFLAHIRSLRAGGDDGQRMTVYQAEPGSADEAALGRLAAR